MKLNVKIFADGADITDMQRLNSNPEIRGLTTNPTLMKKAGIENYEAFCHQVLEFVTEKPISFEVFADDFEDMERQAKLIATWGDNVYVKIPVMNTKRETSYATVQRLSDMGIKVNATAVFTKSQIDNLAQAMNNDVDSYISVFAGRIADTGVDPLEFINFALEKSSGLPKCEVIWASPREAYNIIEASNSGCHIITVTPELIKKMDKFNFDLEEYSLETVQMFHKDALSAGYSL